MRSHILLFFAAPKISASCGLAGRPDTTVTYVFPVPIPCSHKAPLREQDNPCFCSLKGGPEPSILCDVCRASVISKYFSKLRVVTNEMQYELKCLENTL